MSRLGRKLRLLGRDNTPLRDDRRFVIACDDQYAPRQYFEFLKLSRVQVLVLPTVDGRCAAEDVLRRLDEYPSEPRDERWLVLDVDHFAENEHLRKFSSTVRTAQQKGIRVALSKPCFELWLLLHHVGETEVSSHLRCGTVDQALRSALGAYNKRKLNRDDYPDESVANAIERAKRLDQGTSDIPASNTSRVYRILDAIAASVPAYLLPWLR